MYITELIHDEQGNLAGILAGQFNLDILGEIMTERAGLGSGGETYLVSLQNNYLLTPSLYEGYDLQRAYHSEGIDRALTGENGFGSYANYFDVPRSVIGVYRWIPVLEAAFLAEIDEEQALAGAYQARNNSIALAVAAALIAIVGGALYATRIARPIAHLSQIASNLAAGDFTPRARVSSRNEIGQLAQTFNQMSDRLQELIQALGDQVIEAQAARQQAEKSDQVKSAFLASMSHELRTPLNSVINFTKFVAKGVMGPVNEKQVETLNKVVDSGKHLLSLINDVLDMSKIQSGSLNLFMEDEVDVKEILQTAIWTAEGLLQDKPIRFEKEIDPELPTVRVDRQRITQITLNMISNACKFTQEGHVKLIARCEADEMWLIVEDSGPGIAPEHQAMVFEAFKQTETGLRQGGGTGLGMPISKSLIEAHGGRMWFDSVPGTGSTFYVALPVRSKIQQELAPVPA